MAEPVPVSTPLPGKTGRVAGTFLLLLGGGLLLESACGAGRWLAGLTLLAGLGVYVRGFLVAQPDLFAAPPQPPVRVEPHVSIDREAESRP